MNEQETNNKIVSAFESKNLSSIEGNTKQTSKLDQKQMPQNLEAEASILGAILYDNLVLETIIDLVKEDFFYEPLHKEIFKACKILFDQGNIADPITLKGYLKDTNFSRNANIEQYLLNLQEGVLSISNDSILNYAE